MDYSNGYERASIQFIQRRGQDTHGIGSASVRKWARSLSPYSSVLDLGCGTGIPISKVLMDEGMKVYGLDASPSLVKAFQSNFPDIPVQCEAVENSLFFNSKFEGIVAYGLIFLLSEEAQGLVIQKAAGALQQGGKFLFTSPNKKTHWKDIITGLKSTSLGAEMYLDLIKASGLFLQEEFEDEGDNHYFNTVKI